MKNYQEKPVVTTAGIAAAGIIAAAVVLAALTAIGLGIKYFAAPASTAIDNRVFHESQQYNDGMSRDLDSIRREYLAANTSSEAKEALRATVIHRFADYDITRLPSDQQAFLRQIRGY